MRIAVCTCPRTNGFEYALATLKDMELQDPLIRYHDVKIFVAATEAPKFPAWAKVETVDQAYLDKIDSGYSWGRLRGSLDMLRAMRWIGESTEPYGMVFEDDLIFAKDFISRARSAAERCDVNAPGTQWMMKLEHWDPVLLENVREVEKTMIAQQQRRDLREKIPGYGSSEKTRRLIKTLTTEKIRVVDTSHLGFQKWCGHPGLWGSQSYVLKTSAARIAANTIQAGLDAEHVDPSKHHWLVYMDHVAQNMALKKKDPVDLYVSVPCITKHVGEVSVAYPERPLGIYTAARFDMNDRNLEPEQ